LLLGLMAAQAQPDSAWQIQKHRHFLVYYEAGAAQQAGAVGRAAESSYRRIMLDLDFKKHTGFWLWDERVKIYVYASVARFREATGAPLWTRALASHRTHSVALGGNDPDLLDSVLPHELTHLIFRDFLGLGDSVPDWLHEGVAQREEKYGLAQSITLLRGLQQHDRLIPLADLMTLTSEQAARERRALVFYAEAVSLVSFMIDEQGAERFRRFCGQLRDGKDMASALRFTYPASLHSIEALERAWLAYLDRSTRR